MSGEALCCHQSSSIITGVLLIDMLQEEDSDVCVCARFSTLKRGEGRERSPQGGGGWGGARLSARGNKNTCSWLL